MAAAATGGIINSAMNAGAAPTDPNAPVSSTAASASSVGAQPDVTTPASGSNISSAPSTTALNSATADPTGSAAAYLNQLNSAATPTPAASASNTPTPTPAPTSASAPTGIIAGAMTQSPTPTPATPTASMKDQTTGAASQLVNAPPVAPVTTPAPSATPAAIPAAAPTTAQQSQLNALYQSDLGRAPDASGDAFYTGELNSGMTAAQIQAQIVASPEYLRDHSATGIPNGGIATNASSYQADTLGAPTQLNVAPNQTVQGQLTNIMDPNNPIIMQARTGALQQANANGLLNSSMAITAGDNAAYSAAIPIAEQDAGTYNNDAATNAAAANTFAVANQNATNTAGQFNAGSTNTLTGEQLSNQTALTNAQLAAQTSLANQGSQDATSLANQASQNATSVANTGTTTAENLQATQINATNQAQMQTQTSIANLGTTYSNWVSQIQQSSIGDKTDAMATALQSYISQYTALGGNNVTGMISSLGATSPSGASLNQSQISSGAPFMLGGVTYTMQNGVPVAQSGTSTNGLSPTGVPNVSGLLTGNGA